MRFNSAVASAPLSIDQDRSTECIIPVEHIHRSPYRTVAPMPGPSAIAAWLLNRDAHDNVLVRRRPQGGYELLVGEFNWRLAQAARCDTIRAKVLDRADDRLARQLAALDAYQDATKHPGATAYAGELPWCGRAKMAIARAVRVLRKEQNWSLTAAAELFGLSRTEGSLYLRVLTLPTPVLNLIDQGPYRSDKQEPSHGSPNVPNAHACWLTRPRLFQAHRHAPVGDRTVFAKWNDSSLMPLRN